MNDGLPDREGNHWSCEEPLHSSLFVLASCLLWAVRLVTANAPKAEAAADCLGLTEVLGETSTGKCSFSRGHSSFCKYVQVVCAR